MTDHLKWCYEIVALQAVALKLMWSKSLCKPILRLKLFNDEAAIQKTTIPNECRKSSG